MWRNIFEKKPCLECVLYEKDRKATGQHTVNFSQQFDRKHARGIDCNCRSNRRFAANISYQFGRKHTSHGDQHTRRKDKSSGSVVQTEVSLQTLTASSVEDKDGESKKPAKVTASFPVPRQDQLKLEIANLNIEIVFLANKISSGFASDEELERLKN